MQGEFALHKPMQGCAAVRTSPTEMQSRSWQGRHQISVVMVKGSGVKRLNGEHNKCPHACSDVCEKPTPEP
ncbi:MAG: hypothetical protein DYG88_11480 [Chloroflexi bacterium CFX4]|nr:hypothetical protein [Chloroflexi bacterium CFX4]